VSPLRAVLAELQAGEVDPVRLARRLDLSRDEVEAMVDYWVRRERLSVRAVGCPATGCAGCPVVQGSDRSRRMPLRCLS
jgi:hypothetical protein